MDTETLEEVQANLHSLVNRSSSHAGPGTNSSIDYYNDAIFGIENVLQRLVVLQPLLSMEFPGMSQVIQSVRAVIMELNAAEDEVQRQLRRRGRPEIVITRQELQNLLSLQFTQAEISKLYGCSPRTIRRRILRYELQEFVSFSDISDEDLDSLVIRFVATFPNAGQNTLAGYLQSCNLRIQRQRIRDTMARIDPEGTALRTRNILHRREYRVQGPNSLWHIDGNHKLIRWRIVIHGGIDGYSRVPVFLHASDNNRAVTVLQSFLKGVQLYGLPSRVRSDCGGENMLVSEYMLRHPQRGPGRGSFITGRSVHNQRNERFWRDLFSGCISVFYYLFYNLEDCGLLSPSSEADLFALHYAFLPHINANLNVFRLAYNRHRLRTQRNHSPLQLWLQGMLTTRDSTAVSGVYNFEELTEVRRYIGIHHLNDVLIDSCMCLYLLVSRVHNRL